LDRREKEKKREREIGHRRAIVQCQSSTPRATPPPSRGPCPSSTSARSSTAWSTRVRPAWKRWPGTWRGSPTGNGKERRKGEEEKIECSTDVFLQKTLNPDLLKKKNSASKRLLSLRCSDLRQRLLRLLIVSQWSNKARAIAEVGRVLDASARSARAAVDAADRLAYLHSELAATAAPPPDPDSALALAAYGRSQRLPLSVTDDFLMGGNNGTTAAAELLSLSDDSERRAAAGRMGRMLRAALLARNAKRNDLPVLPRGVRVVRNAAGSVTLGCGGEYRLRLSLAPPPETEEEPEEPETEIEETANGEAAAAAKKRGRKRRRR